MRPILIMHMPELALVFGETVSQLSITCLSPLLPASAVYHLSISPASGIGFVLVLGRTWTGQLACLVNMLSSVSLNPTVDKIPVWLTDNSWICYRFSCLRKAWLKSMGVEVLNSCSRLAFLPKFQDLQCGYLQWKTNDRSLQGKERKAE